ncbi:hypothetical protein LZ554_006778 [Drepanopeziza brunnea f. sp. 'monogermtubi']|nr:hypothetical protein LZ554_006778 [Drepanopeziza brunnea f. sp. 'monogermtubi']
MRAAATSLLLHGIVTAPVQSSRDLGPALPHPLDHLLNLQPFLRTDGRMIQRRLQVLVVPFPALLGRAGADELGNAHPVQGPLRLDELAQVRIFLL